MTDLLTDFSDYQNSLDRSPATVREYLTDLTVFSRWLEKNLTALTAADVHEYRASLLEADAAAQTVNRKLAAIAAFGSWASQAGLLPGNPALNVKSVEIAALAPKWLDKKQRRDLVQAVKDDLQTARLRYPRLWLLTERKSSLIVRAGKGTKQRVIPLNKDARQMLDQWLAVRPQIAGDALFTGQRSEPMQPRSIQNAVTRYAEQAGLPDVTCHVCRHTFAKSLIDNGVSLEKVAALLGHESQDTTRLYITPGEKDLELAVAGLAE